jgi:UrcA family protein
MKHLFTCVGVAVCAAAALASPAAAQPVQITRVVHVGDLDLHNQADAKIAARRIHVAADFVCGGDNILFRQDSSFEQCRDGAIDRALASLQAPLVAAALGRPTPVGLASR